LRHGRERGRVRASPSFFIEGAWSHNDFNARSDIFTFRAPFEAVAESRFVGMPISAPHVTETEEAAPADRMTMDAEASPT
jgi:hypothetical protein